jgi:hypothetical protein
MTARLIKTWIRLVLLLAIASGALLLTKWHNWSNGPSPFFAGAIHRDDPLEDVFERVMVQLTRTHSDIEVIRSESSSGRDRGESYSERTKRISCSPGAAEEMMADLQHWCEFAAVRAGAEVGRDRCGCGSKQTFVSFRYEYPRTKGFVKITMKPPEKAGDLKKLLSSSSGGTIDSYAYLYDLHWEIRESSKR